MENFSVTKKTVDAYQIKDERGSGWFISIQSTDNTLDLTVVGERVSWHHYWGACGHSGYCFLADLLNTKDYLKAKFGVNDILDPEATIDSWIKQVLKDRRSEDLTSAEARVSYDPLVVLRESLRSHWIDRLLYPLIDRYCELPSEAQNIIGDSPNLIYQPNPDFEHFFYKVLAPFVGYLKINQRSLFSDRPKNAWPIFSWSEFNHSEMDLWLHVGHGLYQPVYAHFTDVVPNFIIVAFNLKVTRASRKYHKEDDVVVGPTYQKDDLGLLLLSLCNSKMSFRHLATAAIENKEWVDLLKKERDILLSNDPGSIYIKVINALLP